MSRGFQLEKAGPASLVRNLDVVFAFMFQAALMDDAVEFLSVVGAMLILSTAVLIGLKRHSSADTAPPPRNMT